MNLEFEVNTKYLFYLALKQDADMEGWIELKDRFWAEHKEGYSFLIGEFNKEIISDHPFATVNETIKDMNRLIEEGVKSPLFKKLLEETENYRLWLLAEWKINRDRVCKELKDILKIDLPEDTVRVLVGSNKMKCGQHVSKHVIEWGHSEEWPSYSMVYLSHEYLHDILGESNLEHALIELTADQELRIRLNNGGDYFTCDGKPVGHPYLKNLVEKILPRWRGYLKQSAGGGNIFDLISELKKSNDETERSGG